MTDYNIQKKYKEIFKLYDFCLSLGITNCKIIEWNYGYALIFSSGYDFTQGPLNKGANRGYVESCIGSPCDYAPMTLETAKKYVVKYIDRLSGRKSKCN